MRCVLRQVSLAALGISLACSALAAAEPTKVRRTELLAQMRSLAEETKIQFEGSDCRPELVKSPIFRYDDQPRRFLDATIWAWTNQGYPVAFQKIEARLHQSTGEPQWGYCFTSLTEDMLNVEWSSDRRFRSTKPGIKWEIVPGAPMPATRSAERKRQARGMARGFSGRILINPKTSSSAEMRLLPTPMFEYDEPETNLLRGAVFGWETNGTNPDVLVLLEVRSHESTPQWHFAPARMTTGGITLNYQEKKVWEAQFVQPASGPYPTWTFFATPRTPVPEEESP